MLKFQPRIGWQRWENPYALNENEEDNWEKTNSFDQNDNDDSPKMPLPLKIVMTPMGPVPLPEHSSPQKVFNLWTAHTNFDITKNILNLVESTPGVETVDVFTRYRMRVGIGTMFSTSGVIQDINNSLYKSFTNGHSK